MVNALIVPYSNTASGVAGRPGTLDRSTRYASVGFVVGGAATSLAIALRRRRLAR
jgi:hypothetical protein